MLVRIAPIAILAACSAPASPSQPARTESAPATTPAPIGPTTPANPLRIAGECTPDPACWTSSDGFRFVHPLPIGDTLRAVRVLPDGEVWIAGDNATLIRIAGDTITRIIVPGVPSLADVLDELEPGAADRDFPGTRLMKLDFDGLAATSSRDVWIAAGEHHVIHWDGHAWTHHPFKRNGGDELMIGPKGELWVTGANGAALFTGDQVPLVHDRARGFVDGPKIPHKSHVQAIAWQRGDVWVAGYDDLLLRSRGGAVFEPVALPEQRASYNALWLERDGKAGYLVGDKIYARAGDGFAFAHEPKSRVRAVHAFGSGEPAWFVGERPALLEGGTLREVAIHGFVPPATPILSLDSERIEAVHGQSPTDVWMVGRAGMILRYDGKQLRERYPRLTEDDLAGIAWTDDDSWIAASKDGTLLTGSLKSATIAHAASPLATPRERPTVLSKTLAGELILAGCHTDMFKRTTAGAWAKLPKLAGCVRDVHGADAEHLWAVGSKDLVDGKAWRLERGKWIEMTTGMGEHDDLRDVAVGANGDVWLAGDGTLLLARNGKNLQRVAKHEHDDYRHVAIRAPNDVWIATNANDIGSAGTLLHWDGKRFVRHDHLAANQLRAVVALPGGAVWAVGLGGVATFSPDGNQFRPVQLGTHATFDHLIANPAGALVAAGSYGAILQRDPR